MDITNANSSGTDLDLAVNDLGPLAWVLDELRKSLDAATKALRRFVRDADAARGSEMAAVDSSQLRIARQQLHQAVGALEMVGLGAPALMLRSMEAAVQKFVQRPELCTDDAASKVERASFALTEYLEGVIAGKQIVSIALFPQYKEVQEIAAAERIHPADLWSFEWRWQDPQTPAAPLSPLAPAALRAQMDKAALGVVRGQAESAAELSTISLGLAGAWESRQARAFWKVSAAFFESIATGLLVPDVYAKRTVSRIVAQYVSLTRGEAGVSDRLAQDLVFFCAQAAAPAPGQAPALEAVRAAWGLAVHKPVDYTVSVFGHFDPVLVAQARKRIGAAKDSWSALSGGDLQKIKAVSDQFNLVGDSITRLMPSGDILAQALTRAVEGTVRSGVAPNPALAMEVATSVLYVEAVFSDLDPSDGGMALRALRLADRLERVRGGGEPEPLESWMEDLYRRVSDRQTMGSVVGELRGSLAELEKCMDQYFRNPQDVAPLRAVPAQLLQMRGVLSVLGLDLAGRAVMRMREQVEELIMAGPQAASGSALFDKLGNNLGALGFLIDMLNYQPALAKKLFLFDESTGELKPLMGRVEKAQPGTDLSLDFDDAAAPAPAAVPQTAAPAAAPAAASAVAAPMAAPAVAPAAPASAAAAPAAAPADDELADDELRDIFLEEAREVIANGGAAIAQLADSPLDMEQQTTLRRAFHTLKGSSRMVGLTEFGEAAWALEQVMNAWLGEQKPMSGEMLTITREAMGGFARWVDDIAAGTDKAWRAAAFRSSADAMRLDGRLVAIQMPGAAPAETAAPAAEPAPEPVAEAVVALADGAAAAPVVPELVPPEAPPEPVLDFAPIGEPAGPAAPAPAAATPAPGALAMEFDLPDLSLPPVAAPAPAAPSQPAAPEPVFEIDFDAPLDFGAAAAAPAAAPAESGSVPTAATAEIAGIDFDSLASLSALAPAEPPPLEMAGDAQPALESAALSAETGPAPDAATVPAAATPAEEELDWEPDAEPALADSLAVDDEQIKVIGNLRIGIPLYNVYLNEADEWSRRLVTEVAEWALELARPVPESTIGLAHSLAGSSATVGFTALSDLARLLEHGLLHAQHQGSGTPLQGRVFSQCAEEIRRLLHQFAAGFMKEPDAELLQQMRALEFGAPEPATQADAKPAAQTPAAALDEVEFETVAVDLVQAADAAIALEVEEAPAAGATAPIARVEQRFEPVGLEPARPDAGADGLDEEEPIDLADAVDPDLFPIFEEEAVELLPQLSVAMRQWVARPDNASARGQVLRALHTLKGSARLAGALRVGEMAHRMESRIESLSGDMRSTELEPLLQRLDQIESAFDALRRRDAQAYEQAQAQVIAAHDEPAADAARAAASTADTVAAAPAAGSAPASRMAIAPIQTVQTAVQAARSASSQSVRVRSQLLDRLVNQAGEVMITRSRLEVELSQLRTSLNDLTGNLDRLRAQLRDIELQAESQMQTRLAQAKETNQSFDPLEFDRFTRVQELTRMMAESVNDVATVQRNLQRTVESTEDDLIAQARQTRELQRDLLRTRMVEFDSISERLYRVVRQASKETGKQVKLDITGGTIEMDRGVLDRMTAAFEHLLRNCVAHGIEDPAVRAQAGKDASGQIAIGVRQEGNDVSVEFSDDGGGLNLARIRAKAIQQGLIPEAAEIDDSIAAGLIFMPGFSTASEVTELAGRGIGMDVVRSEVNALGGRIETATIAGQGTQFKLVLPLTTAVTQVVMVRAGELSVGVPSNLVEIVRRATGSELEQAYNSGEYDFGGERIPFYWAGALLQSSRYSNEPPGRTIPVIIFRSAQRRVAVHVDEVLGNQEVVVKNLGPQLARLPGLAAMTVLASGAVALIYNPVALAAVYGEQARSWSADRAQPEMLEAAGSSSAPLPEVSSVLQVPLVLVVDDSITVRRVTQRLLQREGYRVALAADGLQALERLQEELPVVVLSDIEMPRMDGFDLARNIRNDTRLLGLPIIMITSRIAEKHREHAMELGVNHYLGKPYSEEELLSLVKRYADEAVVI